MHNIAHINATGGNASSNKNWGISRSESAHGVLSLDLGAVTVDGHHWELDIVKEVIEVVGFPATIDENDGANARHFLKKSQENITLLATLSLEHNLLDVRSSASNTADSETDMRGRKMLLGKISSFLGERRREQAKLYVSYILLYKGQLATTSQSLMKRVRRDRLTAAIENGIKLFAPVILKHLVGFVQNEILQTAETHDMRLVNKFDEPTRSSDQDITASIEQVNLLSSGHPSVHNAGTKHGTIGELPSLIEDLNGQFTGRDNNENKWLGPNLIDTLTEGGWIWAGGGQFLRLAHELAEDRNQVCTRLAGTYVNVELLLYCTAELTKRRCLPV